MVTDSLRWRDYFLQEGEKFDTFWKSFLTGRPRDLLFVLGHGFDERMCDGIRRVLKFPGGGKRDVTLIEYPEGAESPSHQHANQRNVNGTIIQDLVEGRGKIQQRKIQMRGSGSRNIGPRSIVRAFESSDEFRRYFDVIVDISAMPRCLYMPLLAMLLAKADADDANHDTGNLHVIVAHSPEADHAIQADGLHETASYLFGFPSAAMETESTSDVPKVWIPVLGKRQHEKLLRINQLVVPDEICPLLPSPADDPREGDTIMMEYRSLLFDQLRVEPRNIIYAAESNPFEVYRQIMQSILDYNRALTPLGGCKVALSAMSSKLASIGVLLAAYESQRRDSKVVVGIAQVESQGYRLVQAAGPKPAPKLFTMWLTGECYAA